KLWNRIQARSGRIPTDKIGIAWNVIQELRNAPDQSKIGETLADAVSFLLLTGARWSEAAALTWDQVDLKEGWWHLQDPKNRKPLTVPMPKAAVEILERRDKTNPFIFPARSGAGHISEARGVLEKVSAAVGVRVSPHDLRRTFRAVSGECGVEFWKAKLLMGHKISGDVTISHYTETSDLRYLAPESNLIANWIVRQGVIAASNNVIQIPSKAKHGGQS
ncbi:MAG: tyrosine-type recombinase/integrase, partial [Deltaproteobacteria bacterium]|nr:tyrosine-type recombinase/integrase [Deltaproteobacteria bacterium]